MKTLLTGFGPFGDVASNPTARLAAHFAQSGAPGHELTVKVLPVSFERAQAELEELLTAGGFDFAILMGVAGTESEIRVETCARNRDSARIPDCDGSSPSGSIAGSGPEFYQSQVDAPSLVDALREAGIPARLSDNAGGYVCNRSYFAALHTVTVRSLAARCVFLHVPPDERTFPEGTARMGLPFETQVNAVSLVLSELSKG